MQKIFFLLILVNFVTAYQPNLFEQGMPRINHYGEPYLNPTLFSYQHDPIKTILKLQFAIQKAIINALGIKISSQETIIQALRKIIASKEVDLKIYSIIWQKDMPNQAWPSDRTYYYIFHEIAKKWLLKNPPANFNPENFAINVLMGLFNADGVQDLKTGSSMPFDQLQERNVYLHDNAYSPNNANFRLEQNRLIGNFFTVAISPDKKNVVIIDNLIIDNDDLQNVLLQAQEANNLKSILQAINKIAIKLESMHKNNDAKTVLSFINRI